MTNMSRRSVAKGAAWSVPAIAVSAPAAYAATSQYPNVNCVTDPVPSVSITGVKSYSTTPGTAGTYDSAHASLGNPGTYVSLSAGMWQFTPPKSYITGYKLSFPNASQVGIQTFSGVNSYGVLDTSTAVQSAQYNNASAAVAYNIQTRVPYNGGLQNAANEIKGISLPFCVTFLVGLDPTASNAGNVGQCCYYLNWTFNTPVLWSAGVANSGDEYSITRTPQYPGAAI